MVCATRASAWRPGRSYHPRHSCHYRFRYSTHYCEPKASVTSTVSSSPAAIPCRLLAIDRRKKSSAHSFCLPPATEAVPVVRGVPDWILLSFTCCKSAAQIWEEVRVSGAGAAASCGGATGSDVGGGAGRRVRVTDPGISRRREAANGDGAAAEFAGSGVRAVTAAAPAEGAKWCCVGVGGRNEALTRVRTSRGWQEQLC